MTTTIPSPLPLGRPADPSPEVVESALAGRLRLALAADGRGAAGPEVDGRALTLATHAHDASHYLLHPQALVRPRDAGQVAAVMAACTRLGVPLTFRGGGTSLSGQALSDGVLVDVRTGFEGVQVLDDGARVRVQPGVTVRRVNARLAPHRTRLGPDPASEGACTLGGVLANNSSGMQCGTAANSYATIESMVVVLPSGTVVDTGAPDADALLAAREPALVAGLRRLRDRVRDDAASVATLQRLAGLKNTMGYGLQAFLDADTPAALLTRLMIGSEGTLGFIASAVMRTVPVLPRAATGLLVLPDLPTATAVVPQVLSGGVATAELLDAASLRVAAADPACPDQIRRLDVGQHAALLVEAQAHDDAGLAAAVARAEAAVAGLPLLGPPVLTTDAAERGRLWRTRKGLYSAVAGARPAGTSALLEDVAVPVERLGALGTGLLDLIAGHGYEGSVIFGHARDGNLHFMLDERFDDATTLARYERFTTEMVDLVLGLGGTLKAEHGTGRAMAAFVQAQYGAELTAVMHELKELLDPAGILHPGSVLPARTGAGAPDDRAWLRDLKTTVAVEAEVDRCVECGFCEPVCPSRTHTLTPRQRIVARREIAAATARGDQDHAARLAADHDHDVVDTCAADGMCATACPVLIDTGALVRRLRAERAGPVQQRVWRAAAGRWDVVTRGAALGLGAATRAPGAGVVVTRLARRVLPHEQVPAYDPGLGPGGARRHAVADPAPRAVWMPACVGTMFGGGAATAFERLAALAGYGLLTPPDLGSLCCGTPWKSKGLTDGHAVIGRRVRDALAATDPDLPVVIEASSCAEGLDLLLADSGRTVRDAVEVAAVDLLPRLRIGRRLRRVVVHPTCSGAASGANEHLLTLARALAEDVVVPVDWGCCAFAGDRGLLHPGLTAAATAAEAADVVAAHAAGPVDAHLSSNRTCEIGLTRATGHRYEHVLEVLHRVARPR
ncbi:FAD-binding and (Fe-S)-binding domain-containing protein [Nocardioides sp.]|uniref:FAD-binding and (Fe-S)-binding domain-containing protein n=1 Tax=Nocardioides sp. TaxID=35761 RepID=UPI003516BECD